jgi:hypothetical protein
MLERPPAFRARVRQPATASTGTPRCSPKAKGYATGLRLRLGPARASGIGRLRRVRRSDRGAFRQRRPRPRSAGGRRHRGPRLRWLQGIKDKPFFLFFHIYEPHASLSRALQEPHSARLRRRDRTADNRGRPAKSCGSGIYDRAWSWCCPTTARAWASMGGRARGPALSLGCVPLLLKLPGSARAGTSVAAAPVGLLTSCHPARWSASVPGPPRPFAARRRARPAADLRRPAIRASTSAGAICGRCGRALAIRRA